MTKMNWDKVSRENKYKNSKSSIPPVKIKKKVKRKKGPKGKKITSLYNGICKHCLKEYLKGSSIYFHFSTKDCFHTYCPKERA